MKKIFILIAVLAMAGGLYALGFGVSGAYDMIAGPEFSDPFFSAKVDLYVPIIPALNWRVGLFKIDFPEGGKVISFGTGVAGYYMLFSSSDIIIKPPLPSPFKPYGLAGIGLMNISNGTSMTNLNLKGGVGAEMGLGQVKPYIEGGINFLSMDFGGGSDSEKWFYIQGGLIIKLK